MRLPLTLTATASALLVLAGCAGTSPGAGGEPDSTVDLRGEWQLTAGTTADGSLDVPDFALTAVFTEGSARIRTGCFAYDVAFSDNLDVQTASYVSNPRASCVAMDPALDAATQSLDTVTGASRDGDRLALTGDDFELNFVLVPAVASADISGNWTLTSILISDAVQGIENGPTFSSTDGAISGRLGCDEYTGTLKPVSGNNTVTDLSIVPSGDVCTMEIKPGVEVLSELLSGKFLIHSTGESLELISTTDDNRLIFMAGA